MRYSVQEQLKPAGLKGISDEQIQQHWELYKGYVANTNALLEAISALEPGTRAWSELKRRFGFEFDGMVLHEYYFGNLRGGVARDGSSALAAQVTRQFGSVDAWLADLAATGGMRGIGWAIAYHDREAGRLLNCWVGDHESNHPAGLVPILVMDVWEHAYMVDRGATGRADYIQAFLRNVDWGSVERRFAESSAGRIPSRA
jgi:Fe-Mn family superoxide dismutase